jgi:hypothetical protein
MSKKYYEDNEPTIDAYLSHHFEKSKIAKDPVINEILFDHFKNSR